MGKQLSHLFDSFLAAVGAARPVLNARLDVRVKVGDAIPLWVKPGGVRQILTRLGNLAHLGPGVPNPAKRPHYRRLVMPARVILRAQLPDMIEKIEAALSSFE